MGWKMYIAGPKAEVLKICIKSSDQGNGYGEGDGRSETSWEGYMVVRV